MSTEDLGFALKGSGSGRRWLIRCPCAGHGNGRGDRNPSLSIADGANGRLLLKCFAGCSYSEIRDALVLPKVSGAERLAPAVEMPLVTPLRDASVIRMWRNTTTVWGTSVEEYLNRRGILQYPKSIRAGTRHGRPALVACVQRLDGEVVGIQQTLLTLIGDKASVKVPKVTHGRLGTGSVQLGPSDVTLGVAEGIETGLSAQFLSGISVWASLGSQRLDKIELPEGVKVVHIFGDNDRPGLEAARRAAQVHLNLGRRVFIRLPPAGVNDYNDLLVLLANGDGVLNAS